MRKMSHKQKTMKVKNDRKKAKRKIASKAKQKRDRLLQSGLYQNLTKDIENAKEKVSG
tara:strand:- start:1393 stop:1566 length:174 start_codon:yes stop_codon:yes gene_type:complete